MAAKENSELEGENGWELHAKLAGQYLIDKNLALASGKPAASHFSSHSLPASGRDNRKAWHGVLPVLDS